MKHRSVPFQRLALSAGLFVATPSFAASDAEATTHGDKASQLDATFEEGQGSDFFIRQYQLGCLSQLSYLVVSDGEAAVVDPMRDVDTYQRDAAKLGAKITAAVLTHTNADFVAGHMELAKREGSRIYIMEASASKFPHVGLKDGSEIKVGRARLQFWLTPGHTMDSATVLVTPPGAGVSPAYAFTGDTLFIGSIGRPDLVGGDITPSMLASKAFDSIQRLKTLPDATKVLPGHGAGSLCGAGLSDETVSTIGEQKRDNPYLSIAARAPFIAKVVSGLPVAPQYFKYNVKMNRDGPAVVSDIKVPPAKSPAALSRAIQSGAWVLDLRDQREYARGHVSGSINVAVRGRLDTWTGIVVPFDQDLYLVGTQAEVEEATFRLRRIGYDRIAGHLQGGVDAWVKAGQPVRTSRLVQTDQLAEQIKAGQEPMIVDVRTEHEFEEKRLGNYVNIPVDQYHRLGRTLDRSKPVVLLCNSAYRSSMAVGLAEREGFVDVGSMEGGMQKWLMESRPVVKGEGEHKPAKVSPSKTFSATMVPETIEPAALATALMDRPGQYTIIDTRPGWQFDEYHLPDATNVQPDLVLSHLQGLPQVSRVVLVDRDGSAAFSIAGASLHALGSKGPGLRVLSGGMMAFFNQTAFEGRGQSLGVTNKPVEAARVQTPPLAAPGAVAPVPAAAPTPAPTTPAKKRNAGC